MMFETIQLLAAEGEAAFTANLVSRLATFGLFVLGVSLVLCLYRIARGPTLADRAVATDALGVQLVGVVVLLVLRTGSLVFVDGILVLTLLSFAGTVAVAQFIARPFMFGGSEADDEVLPPDEAEKEVR